MLSAFPGSVIYELSDPTQAKECIHSHEIDAVFIETEMERTDAMELLDGLKSLSKDVRVFMMADDDAFMLDAVWNDASGYLLRPLTAEELRMAVSG